MITKERPHGRAKYVTEKCGCDVCRKANTAYGRHQARQRAYGRPAYIDAEPARAHLRALGDAGIGWRRAAELAGLGTAVVSSVLYGRPNRGPAKRVRAATAEKILAVEISDEAMADKAVVAAVGSRRRLRALVAIGWTQSALAERLGLTPANFGPLVHEQPNVTVARRRAVRALYDELWSTPPADTAAARRARNLAQRHGWVPPMAWDDDTIDDPDAVPSGTEKQPKKTGKLPPVDELRWLLGQSSRLAVAQRFGVRPGTIDAALTRSA
jgi:transcriptional regulator with XRE-family HTH domain